jgi:hypothetical protein
MIIYTLTSYELLPNCDSKTVAYLPSRRFRPTWISIAKDVAEHVLITDIKIGKNSQLCSTGSLPGSLFDERHAWLSGKYRLSCDLVSQGVPVEISMTNTAISAFRAEVKVLGYEEDAPEIAGLEEVLVLGFGRFLVKAGHSMRVSAQPQWAFQPHRLHLSEGVMFSFDVVEITRGDEHVKPSSVGALGVSEVPQGTCEAGELMSVWVRNRSDRDAWFSAAMIGSAVE